MERMKNEQVCNFILELKDFIRDIEYLDKKDFTIVQIEEIKLGIDEIYNKCLLKKRNKPLVIASESTKPTLRGFNDAEIRDYMLEKKILEEVNKMINDKLNNFKKELHEEKEINKKSFTDFQNIESYNVFSKLKEILEEEKISQKELCEKTNIGRSTLSYILNNPDTISLKNAYKISKILNKPIEDIFYFANQIIIDDLY